MPSYNFKTYSELFLHITKLENENFLNYLSIRAIVPRFNKIKVEYKTIDNEKKTIVFKDFIARIFQHEFDHLIGLAFIDRVETTKDIISEEVYFKTI